MEIIINFNDVNIPGFPEKIDKLGEELVGKMWGKIERSNADRILKVTPSNKAEFKIAARIIAKHL